HDLLISAYRPGAALERRFRLEAGSAEAAWAFVREHLGRLPLHPPGRERTSHLLFDRMVAFHVQHGVAVPLSASAFHAGLRERFVERDGRYYVREGTAILSPLSPCGRGAGGEG